MYFLFLYRGVQFYIIPEEYKKFNIINWFSKKKCVYLSPMQKLILSCILIFQKYIS